MRLNLFQQPVYGHFHVEGIPVFRGVFRVFRRVFRGHNPDYHTSSCQETIGIVSPEFPGIPGIRPRRNSPGIRELRPGIAELALISGYEKSFS